MADFYWPGVLPAYHVTFVQMKPTSQSTQLSVAAVEVIIAEIPGYRGKRTKLGKTRNSSCGKILPSADQGHGAVHVPVPPATSTHTFSATAAG
jgi:hypothetical protein